jgi:hypothetical protein
MTQHNPHHFSYKNYNSIDKWLREHQIEHYTIEKNLIVNVHQHVDLYNLTQLPFQFGRIDGHFNISGTEGNKNQLTSLKGVPYYIEDTFDCSTNSLTELDYLPEFIGADLRAYGNQISHIKNLHFCEIRDSIDLSYNQITSLEGCVEMVGGEFDISYNPLSSLIYGPQNVQGHYRCHHCSLTNLEGLAQEFGLFESFLYAHSNQIDTLEHLENKTITSLLLSNNKITSLQGIDLYTDVLSIHHNPIEDIPSLLALKKLHYLDVNDFLDPARQTIQFDKKEDIYKYFEHLSIFHEKNRLEKSLINTQKENNHSQKNKI